MKRLARAWAIENGPSGFDPKAPAYFPKSRFLMLMKNERMAEYSTRFNPATGMPSRIIVCDASCRRFKTAPNASVSLAFGCKTEVIQ